MRWSRLLYVMIFVVVGLSMLGWGLNGAQAAPQAIIYAPDSALTPLGAGQATATQRQAAYQRVFNLVEKLAAVDWSMSETAIAGSTLPAGAVSGLPAGNYERLISSQAYTISQAYALQPQKIAIFYPTLHDSYDQFIAWEAGAYEQLFRLYLAHKTYTVLTETQIAQGALLDYDLLMLPSVRVGWAKSVADTLGEEGRQALYDFVAAGGNIYAQGNASWLAESAGLLPAGSVDFSSRVQDGNDNRGALTLLQAEHPLALSWLEDSLYVLDEPALYADESGLLDVIATFDDTSSPDSVAIAVMQVGDGRVILVNGHPTSERSDVPQVIDALLWSMTERGGLTAELCQSYNSAVDCDLIPAYEPGVEVPLTVTFRNTWDGPLEDLRITETLASEFTVSVASIVPPPAQINSTAEQTHIVWELASVAPGAHNFTYIAVSSAPSGTTGGLLGEGEATFVDPYWHTTQHPQGQLRHVQRADSSVRARMAGRLVGDRDIELDVIWPLPAEGWHFDIAMPLENKEETTVYNIVITDVAVLVSPIVDVDDENLIPHVLQDQWGPSSTDELSQTLWAINEIYFYDTPVPLYPMPTKMDGIGNPQTLTHTQKYSLATWLNGPRRVYTFTGYAPFTTTAGYTTSITIPPELSDFITLSTAGDILLPAIELVWEIDTLPGYDYLEPATRYGIWSHETQERLVSWISDPVPGSLILEGFGGSVFTNLGVHPIPYEEYLSHGIINIPTGHTLPQVRGEDDWARAVQMDLRTVFYDVVPFPPPEFHAVVNTTFEMRADMDDDGVRETRVLEVPTNQGVDLTLYMKTFSNFDPDMPPLQKDETLIDQWMFRGLGYDLKPAEGNWWDSWTPLHLQGYLTDTELITVTSSPAYDMLYYQQYLESQQREGWLLHATLSVPEKQHHEGRMKIDNGARFVYHQKAAGPSRYEVFDAHTLVAFGKSADATIAKEVGPLVVSTYSDTLYHILHVEDPWDPRDPGWGPYVRAYGFLDTAATTYVGGRYLDKLLFPRIYPGGETQIRLAIRNNQTGVTVTNLSITPQTPAGITVTTRPPSITESIAPLFFDFPFLHTESISDGWKSVWYFDVQIDANFDDPGKVIEIPFAVSADGLPNEFSIPPAQIAVMDAQGSVIAVWGQAEDLSIVDDFPRAVTPSDAYFATAEQIFALQNGIDSADPLSVATTLDELLPLDFTAQSLESGTRVTFTLPASATLNATQMPWWENDTPHNSYYLVMRSTANFEPNGTYLANAGPQLSYNDDFTKGWKKFGPARYVYAQGAWLDGDYSVTSVQSALGGKNGFIPGTENEARINVHTTNYGDNLARDAFITVTLGPGLSLEESSLIPQAQGEGWASYWIGDMAPGQSHHVELSLSGEPPHATAAWRLVEQTQGHFTNEYPTALQSRQVEIERVLAEVLNVGPGQTQFYLPIILQKHPEPFWPTDNP